MRSIGVIPARIGSTRLPSKPLIKIMDKCLLAWVIEAVHGQGVLDEVYVATDDQRIADLAHTYGVKAVMTDPELASGTDRVFKAVESVDCDVVFNIQGDEPLVQASWIKQLLRQFNEDKGLNMATVATDLPQHELGELATVKVIRDINDNGIYFSRCPIPYTRKSDVDLPGLALKHIGLYAFRKNFLKRFCSHPISDLEKAESLEQLRALFMGEKIRVLKIEGESIGIDTPEDIQKLEMILKARSKA